MDKELLKLIIPLPIGALIVAAMIWFTFQINMVLGIVSVIFFILIVVTTVLPLVRGFKPTKEERKKINDRREYDPNYK